MAAPKILLVDDEGLMLALYKGYIERAGYQLVTAKSGEEAIEMAASERPNLIVMDVIMQGMSGLAALRALKTNETTDTIPVMILTAAVDQQRAAARRESVLGGAVRFLTKPITPAKLLDEIRFALSTPQGDTSDGK
jgi:CheY-like chemotaxis protein